MRITTEQLPQQLSRELKPLYAVFGEEALLALEATDRIRTRARDEGYTEREILSADAGFRWKELAFAGGSQSLFSARKLLELRIPSGKPGAEGGEALQAYCEAPPPEVITLIYLPAIDWRAQKSAWFEALGRAGVLVEARAVPRKSLPQWIAGRLHDQSQDADRQTLDFIADRVEGNLLAAYQEVQKLSLLFGSGKIAFDEVRNAVLDVARFDVFNLGSKLVEGDALHFSRMLDGLRGEGVAPPLVLWALTDEIRAIGKIITGIASGKPLSMMWREARIWGNSHQELLQRNVKRFSLVQVTESLRHAASIDRMIKGLARGDVWDELLRLGLRFAQGAATRPTGKSGRMAAVRAGAAARDQSALF